MAVRRERFVSTRHFLESARSLDITPIEGFYELFDNAFDADATSIRAHIEKKENGNLRFYIIDNGRGIRTTHTDSDGVVHQGIPYVLAYGGRIPHPGREREFNKAIGKFGVGLSQTASSLSTRTEIYTKTSDDDDWRFGYYDFAELYESEDCTLEPETHRRPPWIDLPDTGTIIVLDDVDKAKRNDRPVWILNHLERTLGQVYRRFLNDGRTLNLSIKRGPKDAIDDRFIRPSDPLHQMPQSVEVQTFGLSEDYGTVTIRFDEHNSIGYIPNFRTGRPAEIRIRLVRLSMENIRRKLGIALSGPGSVKGGQSKSPLTKWGINEEGQGFSIVRNGRELRSGESLGLFTKDSVYNYFRGEVDFDDELDRLFNIQTNKSRYTMPANLQNMIRDRVLNTIQQIARDHKKERNTINLRKQKLVPPTAEKAASKAATRSDFKRRPLTAEQKKAAEKEINARVKRMVDDAKREGEEEVKAAKEVLERAHVSRDKGRIQDAEEAVKSAKTEAKARVQTIRDRFDFHSPVRKMYGKVGNGDIYAVEDLDTEVWVTINTDSPFYKMLYERATQKPEMESLLDLMLFSIAHAEHLHGHSDELLSFWDHARSRVSSNAYTFVSRMAVNNDSGEL
ncbi:MAG: ATP-binding protein [Candidatus Thermoplasmatota archaeon]|nr:ATP-binding protein [Candidatus Thermoplasmatota archaeon]